MEAVTHVLDAHADEFTIGEQLHGWEGPAAAAATFRDAYESVRPLPTDVAADRDPYVALVSASYLDSLHTQQGIDDDTRERADAIEAHIHDTLDAARASLSE